MSDDAARIELPQPSPRPSVRGVRIGTSAFFGMLTLVMVLLWVRSYTYSDQVWLTLLPSEHINLIAADARMCVWFEHQPTIYWFEWRSHRIMAHISALSNNRIPAFDLNFWPTFARLYIAHWVLAVAAACLAVAPWLRLRYSLRAILLAMTAIAVLVGMIAWIDRTL
jgi:hypothetical protein